MCVCLNIYLVNQALTTDDDLFFWKEQNSTKFAKNFTSFIY